jgi:uncharacterized protein YlxW (UPF0749 family)
VHLSLGDVGTIAGLIGLFIVIAGVLGAAFRVSRNTQTVANYRESAQAWETKANVQADEIKELKEQVKDLQNREREKETQVVALQEQISGLRDLLTNRATFEVLEHRTAEVLALVGETRTEVRKLIEQGGTS